MFAYANFRCTELLSPLSFSDLLIFMHFLIFLLIVVSRCSLHVTSLCSAQEQLSYSRSQSFSSWFCMRMDLSNLWPWSFYVCVESLFDRLDVRGQIESFTTKSTPKVFGYNFTGAIFQFGSNVWEKHTSTLSQSCSGRAMGTGAS